MATEYPKNLYRWTESGEKVSKLFKSEAEVEAGWVAHEDLGAFGAKPVSAAKASAPPPEDDDLAAKIADAEKRAAEADAALAALEDESEEAPKPRRTRKMSD